MHCLSFNFFSFVISFIHKLYLKRNQISPNITNEDFRKQMQRNYFTLFYYLVFLFSFKFDFFIISPATCSLPPPDITLKQYFQKDCKTISYDLYQVSIDTDVNNSFPNVKVRSICLLYKILHVHENSSLEESRDESQVKWNGKKCYCFFKNRTFVVSQRFNFCIEAN